MAFKQNNPLSRKTSPINKNWIKGAIKRPGAFKKKAEDAGMSTKAFANKVIANKEDYDSRTDKQAELAKTLMGMSRHEKDHDDKTFTMGELNERSKKQDSLSKKQALKLPQREGLGNPDYEFNEDQRFAGDDGYDDGMSRKSSTKKLKRKIDKFDKTKKQYLDEVRNKPGASKRQKRKGEKFDKTVKQVQKIKKEGVSRKSSPHGTYADQGLIKSYKNDKGEHVAIDGSVHKKPTDERHASGKALKKAQLKARKVKAAKKGVSRKSSPLNDKMGGMTHGEMRSKMAKSSVKKHMDAHNAKPSYTNPPKTEQGEERKRKTGSYKKGVSRKSSPINKDKRHEEIRELSVNKAMKGKRTMKNRDLKPAGKVIVKGGKADGVKSMRSISSKAKSVTIPKSKPKRILKEDMEARARRSVKAPSKDKVKKMSISRKKCKYKK